MGKARVRLSDAVARNAVADPEKAAKGNDDFLWDSDIVGFGLKFASTGGKSWVFRYRNEQGQTKRITLGSFQKMSAAAARAKALSHQSAARNGRDPAAAKVDQRKARTIGDHLAEWIEAQEGRASRGEMAMSTVADYRSKVRLHFADAFGRLKPTEFTPTVIKEWRSKKLSEAEGAPARSVIGLQGINAALRILSAFGNYLVDKEIINKNPAARLKQYSVNNRQRYLTDYELRNLLTVLNQYRARFPVWISIIELALLTGMRKTEILSLRWDAVNEKDGRITLKSHKTHREGGAKILPLGDAVLKILGVARSWQRAGNPYVFPGAMDRSNRDGHASASGLKFCWEQVRKAAGLNEGQDESFVIHSFRHSFASFAINSEQLLPNIGAAMGHSTMASTYRYAKLNTASAAKATSAVGSVIAAERAKAREG